MGSTDGWPYQSLSEFVTFFPSGVARDEFSINKTYNALRNSPKILQSIQNRLNDIGFRKLKYFNNGEHAIAFISKDNQIVRISLDGDFEQHNRPKEPFILQPIHSETLLVKGREVLIEVLPKVNTTEVTDEMREMLGQALRKSGYHIFDLNFPGNIGWFEVDGIRVPVLIDCGDMAMAGAHTTHEERSEAIKPWLDMDGKWLQSRGLTWMVNGFKANLKAVINLAMSFQEMKPSR